MDPLSAEVAARLRERVARVRAAKGALARDAGITYRVLAEILHGSRAPSVTVFTKLCHALGVSAGELLQSAEQTVLKRIGEVRFSVPRPAATRAKPVVVSDVLPAMLTSDLADALSTDDPEVLDRVLARARELGWGLQPLGDAIGVTRERVRQRVKRFNDGGLPSSGVLYPEPPRVTARRALEVARRANRSRVNGLKVSDRAMLIEVATLQELARLSTLATANRTWTPLDAPERAAIEPYKALLIDLVDRRKVAAKSLDRVLGYQTGTVRSWLARHGYGSLSPSQKAFKGVHVSEIVRPPSEARRTIVLGGRCKKGHLITDDNMVMNGSIGFICGTCRKERTSAAYRRSREAVRRERES